ISREVQELQDGWITDEVTIIMLLVSGILLHFIHYRLEVLRGEESLIIQRIDIAFQGSYCPVLFRRLFKIIIAGIVIVYSHKELEMRPCQFSRHCLLNLGEVGKGQIK